MKSKLYLLAVAIGMIASGSCKKFDNKPIMQPKKIDTDVYAVGYTYTSNGHTQIASYWKNGVLHKISDSTGNVYLNTVAAHDTDVVMVGTQANSDLKVYTAFYYRNGQKTTLSDNAAAGGVAFSKCGCEVYICGVAIQNGFYKPVYWKNGEQISLPSSSPQTTAIAIAINGSDIYIAGEGITTKKTTYAMYWKNGVPYNLTDTLANSVVSGISINDAGDVYIGGYTITAGVAHPTYWKNGTANLLSDEDGNTNSIFAQGSDLYALGAIGPVGGDRQLGYWKNGAFTPLTAGAAQVNAYQIVVQAGDVYAPGVTILGADLTAGYWKNGAFNSLPGNLGAALGIAFVTKPH